MAQAFAKADILSQPEYSIYIYHRPENQHEGQNDWEMRTMTLDLNEAMDEAESLHRSQGYRKIEVKQRIIDPKTALVHDYTLKVFATERDKLSLEVWLASFAVLFSAAAVIWFLNAFF